MMTVLQTDKIDIIGTDKATGHVILTIIDDQPWDDADAHILVLQDKLNTYLAFIESGDILDSYPTAAGRHIVIRIAMLYDPMDAGKCFLRKAGEILGKSGYIFELTK